MSGVSACVAGNLILTRHSRRPSNRYYYAIVEFSDVSAATYIYREVNGTEFERTANVFDISFVPDDMEFDEDYHEVATEEAKGYKGNDFVTDVSAGGDS